ncbi:TPA: hypothetical protein N0F65_011349 [Lagenidium giganteum]|uniref:Ankyrin repeat protein n=1 Tax=Lagenidium giganteum TaxID=4803 RepID=A0AAV2Z8I5_9STRA|nr:TPA: hypothetical protein N0F65_011349 [Lagenidium giganteum]
MSKVIWDEVQGACDVRALQQAVAECSDRTLVMDGWTPLQYLCENRSVENEARTQGIALLLKSGVADGNAVDENGWTALHLLAKSKSASEAGDITASVRQLLAGNVNVNAKTSEGKTALHYLCENEASSTSAIEALLQARADVNAVDEDGNTPLHLLAESSGMKPSTIQLLLSAKSNPNAQNQFQAAAFHYVCQNSNVTPEIIRLVLQHGGDPNVKNNIGNTPLHYICENYSVSVPMLEEFINSKRVNVTLTNALGKTAFECIPDANTACRQFAQKFAAPTLQTSNTQEMADVGGEDASELPVSLQGMLQQWNASLPPFDMAFYNAICCEPAFSESYEQVADVSVQVCSDLSNTGLIQAWQASLNKWRSCVVLAYCALIAPTLWDQYAQKYNRAVPADLIKKRAAVEDVWRRFPEQVHRRERFEALSKLV